MHPSRTRALALLVPIALSAGLLAGCGPFGDDKPAQAQDRSGRLLTAVEAKTALPSVASLPQGWSVAKKNPMRPVSAARDKVTPARCRPIDVDLPAGFVKAKTKSYRTFVSRRGDVLGIGIGSHAGAAPGFQGITTALKSCRTVVVVTPDEKQTGIVKPLHLPDLGHETVAFQLRFRTSSSAATYDVVRVRVGHNIVLGDLITVRSGTLNTKPLVTGLKNVVMNLS